MATPSIAMIPSGYKDGKVYSVLPNSSDGDFNFTRGSAATRVNAQGLVENVQIISSELVSNGDFSQEGSELITNGDFSNGLANWVVDDGTSWTNVNDTAFCDGNNGLIRQNITSTANKVYKVTFDTMATNSLGKELGVRISNGTYAWSLYSTGTHTIYLTAGSSSYDDVLFYASGGWTGSIDNVSVKEVGQDWNLGTGWSIGDNEVNFIGSAYGNSLSQNNVSTFGKTYAFDCDLINGSFDVKIGSNSYFAYSGQTLYITADNSGAADAVLIRPLSSDVTITNISVKEITDDTDLPRLDYSDGSCPSLLLEPQSTNLVTYSEDIASNGFAKIGTSIQADVTTSPDGTINSDLIQENSSSGSHFIYKDFNLSSGQTYAISVFAKKNGTNRNLRLGDGGVGWSSGFNADFDLTNGTSSSGVIEDYGNGWYRCSVVGTANATTSRLIVYSTLNASPSYQGDGSSGVFLYGFQIEEKSHATSYIPTNGGIATRLADQATGSGNASLINSTEGVLYAEGSFKQTGSTNGLFAISDGTFNNLLMVRYSPVNRLQVESTGGVNILETNTRPSGNYKIAVKYSSSGVELWVNGSKIEETSTVSTMSGINQLMVGKSPYGNIAGYKNKALAVYKEALTDAELQELTTI